MTNLRTLARRFARQTNRMGLEIAVRRVRRSSDNQRVVYFLHIGKAAGSQIKGMMHGINKANPHVNMVGLTHDDMLWTVPSEAEYFFSIREPISRFRSAFYSRKRMGRPLYDVPWSDHEARAFSRFEHASDLADALFEPGELGLDAVAAIKSIRHTSQNQIDWFSLAGDIFTVRPPLWVLRQEHLDEDLQTLFDRLGLEKRPELARGSKKHANDYKGIPDLTKKGIANLQRWYAQDIALYDAVETWMQRERSAASDQGRQA